MHQNNRPSTFSGISCKETIPSDLLDFMTHIPPSILYLSHIIILSVRSTAACVLFFGGSFCKLWVMLSPHCALQCQHACVCLESFSRTLSQECIVILEVACVCLTEARVSQTSSTCFGLQRSHDGSSSRHATTPSNTFSFLFMRARTNKRGV